MIELRKLFIVCLFLIAVSTSWVVAEEADYFGMPDRMDIETWPMDNQRIATTANEDGDAILYEDPIRYIDLDNDRKYEVVLLAERVDDSPNSIPPERSYLYIFKKFGERWDRMLFHDCGMGRFKHLAFPDFDGDGIPEILATISSKYALDYDRFEILKKGGYYFRPWKKMDKKVYMISDLDSDGKLDIITTHRYKPEEFFLFRNGEFVKKKFKDISPYLLNKRISLYKHLVKKIEEKRRKLEGEE